MKALLLLPAVLVLGGCTFLQIGSRSSDAPLVPANGRIEHVWHVPAGTGAPELVVGWSYSGKCGLSKGLPPAPGRCHALTVWRDHRTSTTLFGHSPFPFDATSVRAADVTGDGHRDLLVTIECNECNHAVATAAVYADMRGRMRRIYGDTWRVGVPGRQIFETAWGAWRGLVWFDVPHYGPQSSLCCPDYRIQTFLRWDGAGWRTMRTRKVSAEHDNFLGRRPVPAP